MPDPTLLASAAVIVFNALLIASDKAEYFLAAARLKFVLIFDLHISIGFKSGEYGGK